MPGSVPSGTHCISWFSLCCAVNTRCLDQKSNQLMLYWGSTAVCSEDYKKMWTNIEICKVKPGDKRRKYSAVKEELLTLKIRYILVLCIYRKFEIPKHIQSSLNYSKMIKYNKGIRNPVYQYGTPISICVTDVQLPIVIISY